MEDLDTSVYVKNTAVYVKNVDIFDTLHDSDDENVLVNFYACRRHQLDRH